MKKLHIIYTGGTIGGNLKKNKDVIDEDIRPKQFLHLLSKKFPNLKEIAEISYETPVKKFSENIIPTDWVLIARSILKAVNNGVDCIIIPHGTDTMPYTAAALSFLVQGLNIPVILTGSNYPFSFPNTDADQNLSDAIRVALDGQTKGIFIVFSGINNKLSTIHLGTRVRKVKFYDNCFQSINTEPIGVIKKKLWTTDYKISIINNLLLQEVIRKNTNLELTLKDNLNDNILFFKVYPGFNTKIINCCILEKPPKGLIFELYNSGTGCIEGKYSLLPLLETATKKFNVPTFVTSQNEGNVNMDTYISSKQLKSTGAIPLRDMLTEAAIPKLMWALGQVNSKEEIINLMLTDIAGEISEKKDYGYCL